MSFVIPTITFFDKGTLKAADVISCTAWDKDHGAGSCDDAASFAWGGAHHTFPNPKSYALLSVSYMANLFLLYSFIIGLSLYVSMSWGRCREDPAAFEAWFDKARWPLLIGYVPQSWRDVLHHNMF